MSSDNVEYMIKTFKGLRELQIKGILCDLVLMSKDYVEFRVHASVVVTASQSFHDLLIEKGSLKKIRLMNISGKELALLIRFFYGETFDSFDELKLLSQTLMKLGMKDLFSYIGTSLCDIQHGKDKRGSPGIKSHDNRTNLKSTYQNEKSQNGVVTRGDNSIFSPIRSIKAEPFSDTPEKDTFGDYTPVKIKSEPKNIDSDKYDGQNLEYNQDHQYEEKRNEHITSQSNGMGQTTAKDKNALKPAGLLISQTGTTNGSQVSVLEPKGSLLNIECLAEKYGIIQPLLEGGCSKPDCDHIHHSYKAVIDGVKITDKQTTKTPTKVSSRSEDDVQSSLSTLPQTTGRRHNKKRPVMSKDEMVPAVNTESKHVPVLLRLVDDQGHYAIFPVAETLSNQDEPGQSNQVIASDQFTNKPKPTQFESHQLDVQTCHVVKDSHPVIHGGVQIESKAANTVVQTNANMQPQINQQTILASSSHLVPILPRSTNLTNTTIIGVPGLTKTKSDLPFVKLSKQAPRKKYTPQSRKVREIAPKTELKIENVISLQEKGKSSDSSGAMHSGTPEDCASKRMKHTYSVSDNECVEMSKNEFDEKYKSLDKVEDHPNIMESDMKSLQKNKSNGGKRRKLDDPEDFQAKIRKEPDSDEDDSQDYLVINLDIDSDGNSAQQNMQTVPCKTDVQDLPQVDKNTANGKSDKFNLNDVFQVPYCTLEEVPDFVVARKSKGRKQVYTVRKPLNFFHDKDEIPPNQPLAKCKATQALSKISTGIVTSKIKTDSLPVSCAQIVSRNVSSVQQTMTKSQSGNTQTVSQQSMIPVMVCLQDGKVATVMVENPQLPQIPAVSQVHPNTNIHPQKVPVQNISRPAVHQTNCSPLPFPIVPVVRQPISTVISGTQQLISGTQQVQQPIANIGSLSNVVQNVLQPPIISGPQAVHPQFLVRNIACQNVGQATTPSVQFSGQQCIVRQIAPAPTPFVPTGGQSQISQTLTVPGTLPVTQPRLNVIGADSQSKSAVAIRPKVTTQLMPPATLTLLPPAALTPVPCSSKGS